MVLYSPSVVDFVDSFSGHSFNTAFALRFPPFPIGQNLAPEHGGGHDASTLCQPCRPVVIFGVADEVVGLCMGNLMQDGLLLVVLTQPQASGVENDAGIPRTVGVYFNALADELR